MRGNNWNWPDSQRHSASKHVYKMLQKYNAKMPVIRASTSYVSTGARLGDATMVFHNAVVNIGVKIGSNCIINTSAVVEHGCSIGSHTHIAPRSVILVMQRLVKDASSALALLFFRV